MLVSYLAFIKNPVRCCFLINIQGETSLQQMYYKIVEKLSSKFQETDIFSGFFYHNRED